MIEYINRLFVMAYKSMGFIILALMLFGMAAYIYVVFFYIVDRSWVMPIIVTAHDDKAVQLQRQMLDLRMRKVQVLSQMQTLQSQLFQERSDIKLSRGLAEKLSQVMLQDQHNFHDQANNLNSLLTDRTAEAKRLLETVKQSQQSEEGLLDKELATHIIDRNEYLRRKASMADQSMRNLDAAGATFDMCMSMAMADQKSRGQNIDIITSEETKLRAQESVRLKQRDVVGLQLQMEELIKIGNDIDLDESKIMASPYWQASASNVVLAFVPYDNMKAADTGKDIYSCLAEFVFCTKAGRLGNAVDAEVDMPHPMFGSHLRGVFREVELTDPNAAQRKILLIR